MRKNEEVTYTNVEFTPGGVMESLMMFPDLVKHHMTSWHDMARHGKTWQDMEHHGI